MSSTIRNKRVLILHEMHTEFISMYLREENDNEKVGAWLKQEMRNAVEFCLDKNVMYPDMRITTTMLSQWDYDSFEVRDYLKHVELLGDPR